MSVSKMNVLVYTGTGTTIESVRHAVYSLRRLLSANYAVIPISESILLKEPWQPSCALLVVPGGADLGYCRVLNGTGNSLISQFVRKGGAYLGFCAGGYYGSKKCEFEVGNKSLEVVGSRELGFFQGTCRGGAYKGFQYQSEVGARAVKLNIHREAFGGGEVDIPAQITTYFNGGGVFLAEPENTDVEVVASYADPLDVDGGKHKAAAVFCKVGLGSALLFGPHPEFSTANMTLQHDIPGYSEIIADLRQGDAARVRFMRACLSKLSLEVGRETAVPPLSSLHLSSLESSDVDDILHGLQEAITHEDGKEYIKGENDTFILQSQEPGWAVESLKQSLPSDLENGGMNIEDGIIDYSTITKRIIVHDNTWPDVRETPYFNHKIYYDSLRAYRRVERGAETWGDHFMYGEVVTSTNTLLDKNFNLLSRLPTGFTLAATTSVAARGRGTNVWLGPPGQLIMSTVINHPAQLGPSRPIVFIQYLAALAIAEAIKTYGEGYGDVPVKLKWPNDIYALDPSKSATAPPSYVKIGGILSNCAYSAGNYQIVLGIGLNTTNSRPTTSLNDLLPPHLKPFSIEKLQARILSRLEVLYKKFVSRGFTTEMEDSYYDNWLHGYQIVSLEQEAGARARIIGITRDWGMLKAEELGPGDRPTGKIWALQSDENSFDFFRGLLKRKI
jgi:biotin---protein ligase